MPRRKDRARNPFHRGGRRPDFSGLHVVPQWSDDSEDDEQTAGAGSPRQAAGEPRPRPISRRLRNRYDA